MKSYLLVFMLVLTLVGCNSDDNNSNPPAETILYLKAYKSQTFQTPGEYDSFYEYNSDGYLINASGFTTFYGNYQYDSSNRLVSKISGSVEYIYQYYNDGKLFKRIEVGNNNTITLTYSANKVYINNTYNDGTYVELSELDLDTSGRIVKYQNLTPTSSYEFMVQEYSYDSKGNIIQCRYKQNNYGDPDRIVNYAYDDSKNPFYYAYRKVYQSIYYLECRRGIQNYKHMGITPNNILSAGSEYFTHTYNNTGYPTQWIRHNNNGVFEYNLEYY